MKTESIATSSDVSRQKIAGTRQRDGTAQKVERDGPINVIISKVGQKLTFKHHN